MKITIEHMEFSIRAGTVDENVLREVIESDCYHLRDLNLPLKPTIIDVGGHIGGFTRYAYRRWPLGKFLCFEANPRNWDLIEKNLAVLGSRVTLYKGALVGSVPTNKYLSIRATEADRITGGWGLFFTKHERKPTSDAAIEEIDSFFKIKDILKEVEHVDLLKLDCEGSEWSILHSMTKEQLSKVDHIVAEIHCGALPHAPTTYEKVRNKLLEQFYCPELEKRVTCTNDDLFNIVAHNKSL